MTIQNNGLQLEQRTFHSTLAPTVQNATWLYDRLEIIRQKHLGDRDSLSICLRTWIKETQKFLKNIQVITHEQVTQLGQRLQTLFDRILVNPIDEAPLQTPRLVNSMAWEDWMLHTLLSGDPDPLNEGQFLNAGVPHLFAGEVLNLFRSIGVEMEDVSLRPPSRNGQYVLRVAEGRGDLDDATRLDRGAYYRDLYQRTVLNNDLAALNAEMGEILAQKEELIEELREDTVQQHEAVINEMHNVREEVRESVRNLAENQRQERNALFEEIRNQQNRTQRAEERTEEAKAETAEVKGKLNEFKDRYNDVVRQLNELRNEVANMDNSCTIS